MKQQSRQLRNREQRLGSQLSKQLSPNQIMNYPTTNKVRVARVAQLPTLQKQQINQQQMNNTKVQSIRKVQPRKLLIKKNQIQTKQKTPHFHVSKKGVIHQQVTPSQQLISNRVNKLQTGLVLDRMKNRLIDEHIEDTDIGFQSIHASERKRKTLVRGAKNVKNFVQTNQRSKYLGGSAKNLTKFKAQNTVVGAMESESAVLDTGSTATGQSITNAQTGKEVLKKGKSLLRGENLVRSQKRYAKMKGVSKKTLQGFQAGKQAITKASHYIVLKIQQGLASKGLLLFGLFFGLILIIGVSIGGIGGAFEMQEQEEVQFSANGLSDDVLQWKDPVETELAKYNLLEYTDLVLVIIKLESDGRLPDVMQSSESIGLPPNTIGDPIRSIKYGVAHFKNTLDEMNKYNTDIQSAIGAYNYGLGFIPYVSKNGGTWKQSLSDSFSDIHAQKLGWSSYGDKSYVSKAMRYLVVEDDEIRMAIDTDFDLKGQKLVFPVPNHSRISSPFGYRIHPIEGIRKLHSGIDIPATTGTPVVAAADGVVIESGWKGGYGNAVVIDHGSSIQTLYAHNSELVVKAGQKIKAGQVVAKVGSTGSSTNPHSHFEVRKNGEYTDPENWLN